MRWLAGLAEAVVLAAGHGIYALTILTAASKLPDKTFCDLLSGNVSAKGTSVTFKASGPLTLKQ
jgi:hypothetical protein